MKGFKKAQGSSSDAIQIEIFQHLPLIISVDKAFELELTLARRELTARQESNSRLLTLQAQLVGGFAVVIYAALEQKLDVHIARFLCSAVTWITYVIVMSTALNVSHVVALAHFTAGELNRKYRIGSLEGPRVWDWDVYRADLVEKKRKPLGLTLSMRSPNIDIAIFCFLAAVVFFFILPPRIFSQAYLTPSNVADAFSLLVLVVSIGFNIRALIAYRRSDQ